MDADWPPRPSLYDGAEDCGGKRKRLEECYHDVRLKMIWLCFEDRSERESDMLRSADSLASKYP